MNAEVLEKVINKVPFLCRLGFHKWRAHRMDPRVGMEGGYIVTMRCLRCTHEKTEVWE